MTRTPATTPKLLAGTRVTGARPHLGTYYGWIRPVVEAAKQVDVVVLIADLQSFDPFPDEPMKELSEHLAIALRRHLPADVPIVLESAVRGLPTLAYLVAPLFARHHWNRVAPLRRLKRDRSPSTVATMLYPAMMVADLLAFDATHVLAKPEGNFQHVDVLNDVLARVSARFGWTANPLELYPKPRVDIPRADGSGTMKRNQPGHLNTDAEPAEISTWAATLSSPGHQTPAEARLQRCKTVWPIWKATAAGMPSRSPRARQVVEIYQECTSNKLPCTRCKQELAASISYDLHHVREFNPNPAQRTEKAICEAERRVRSLIHRMNGEKTTQ